MIDSTVFSVYSEMKKLRGLCGVKEKRRGANIDVSRAWLFSVVMKIDLLWLNLSKPPFKK